MTDWNKIETDIKTDTNNWDRFAFMAEQISHAYVNLYVEKGREYKVPKILAKILAFSSLMTPIPIFIGVYALVTWNKSDDTSTI